MKLYELLPALRGDAVFEQYAGQVGAYGETPSLSLSIPEIIKPFLIAALFDASSLPVFVIESDQAQADALSHSLAPYSENDILFLPERGAGFVSGQADATSSGSRAKAMEVIADGRRALVVTTAAAAAEKLPALSETRTRVIRIVAGQIRDMDELIGELVEFGYERVHEVEDRGEFSVRGGILDVFGPDMALPVRMEFDGDTIAGLRIFGLLDQISIENASAAYIYPLIEEEPAEADLFEYARGRAAVVCVDAAVWPEGSPDPAGLTGTINLSTLNPGDSPLAAERHPVFIKQAGAADFDGIREYLIGLTERGYRIVAALEGKGRRDRFRELLTEWGLAESRVAIGEGGPGSGFVMPRLKLAVLTEEDMFGHRRQMRQTRQSKSKSFFDAMDLKPGDYVVHVYHGIGRYNGLTAKEVDGNRRDYLLIEYAEGDRLYVPADQIGLIQRYVAGEDVVPRIDRLGSKRWQAAKRKVKASAAKLAAELVRLYSARREAAGFAFSPDTPWQRELEDSFPFAETPDQETAIADVKADMMAVFPMDRLICGDVGYGKTEVAVRAVFKAVMDGKQAAVLVPTTLLAEQHFETFKERFGAFPVRVETLSRMRGRSEQAKTVAEIAAGKIDVVIGTHRLLQKDVVFHDLGLFVIDEEQRFGVRHKEFLKSLRLNVDVLTLSATPIPRTLNMALSGARDMSVIDTPPEDRYPVATRVGEYDDAVVKAAVDRELNRGGQVFFVHNRVDSIGYIAERLRRLVPGTAVAVSHGQMSEKALETVMMEFADRQHDVLVSTTIIESGLDMPNVNTLIVDRADKLGLSQLYQLRGRVGRSDRRAYAYFLYPSGTALSVNQVRRLKTIAEFTDLGSGFRIAMRDLEIRGAGELLGAEQHGFIADIGFELYSDLLAQAVSELKGEKPRRYAEIKINLAVAAFIPEEYIGAEAQRIEMYKKIAAAESESALETVRREFRDRFGPIPRQVDDLLRIAVLKNAAAAAGITRITAEAGRVRLAPVGDAAGASRAIREAGGRGRYKEQERALYIEVEPGGEGVSLLTRVVCGIITNDFA